jgi:hypothetical protein
MKNTLTATENELKIMTAALPVVEAVPESQDSCWPGDGPAHDDDCTETDHAASIAAVAATEGLSWEFSSWTATAAWFRTSIEEAEAIAAATEEWDEDAIREYIESHDENDKTPDEQLLAMFRSVYGRSPEGREEHLDMWSHICAGVSHS